LVPGFASYTASAPDSTEFGSGAGPFGIGRIKIVKAAGRGFWSVRGGNRD
jgi:hypothetical protein